MTSPPVPVPRIVDRYALFDVIATGGMASVHLGRLIGPVGFSRTVAIKRLHENFARDPEFVAMFLDEARLVARIRHPNVVQTLDVVACAQELLVVMEYVAGESLALLIKRARSSGRLTPIPVVVDVLTSVLNGLHAAHEATDEKGLPLNVVHRDVSPHNILVGTDGVTRVLDFGIAKATGHFHHSREGQVKGKIRYMPPEQIRGNDVNRAVYAASVVLWETLTCSRLHGAGNDGEILYRVLEGNFVRPSELRPDVPRMLDEIVARGLHPDPNQRFQTAKEMVTALEKAAPPVTRNAISAWVLESAPNEIQAREESLARVEGTMTPITASKLTAS
jgi:serine/threonine protein kinase